VVSWRSSARLPFAAQRPAKQTFAASKRALNFLVHHTTNRPGAHKLKNAQIDKQAVGTHQGPDPILPGLRIPFGSSEALMARIIPTADTPCSISRYPSFPYPIPCSPAPKKNISDTNGHAHQPSAMVLHGVLVPMMGPPHLCTCLPSISPLKRPKPKTQNPKT